MTRAANIGTYCLHVIQATWKHQVLSEEFMRHFRVTGRMCFLCVKQPTATDGMRRRPQTKWPRYLRIWGGGGAPMKHCTCIWPACKTILRGSTCAKQVHPDTRSSGNQQRRGAQERERERERCVCIVTSGYVQDLGQHEPTDVRALSSSFTTAPACWLGRLAPP